ncbi:syncytin-2-like [Lissotriton helveticus]
MDIYWACGEHIYLQLPPHWQGLCSIVTMHELHLVVPAANISRIHTHPMADDVTLLHRGKREIMKYFSDGPFHKIPQDYRLFNDAELFFGGVIPMFQTKANARWLQVTRYELMQLINNTRDGFNAVKEELRPLRLMVLEHRYVLDQLTAMNGGVCAKVGKSCCTFILANDADNGTLTKAIEDLDNLGKEMHEEGGADADLVNGWFDLNWMPSWLSAVLKFLMPIFCVLLLLCFGTQMLIYCVKRFSSQMIGMNYVGSGSYTGIRRDKGDNGETTMMSIVELTIPDSRPLPDIPVNSQYQAQVHRVPPHSSQGDLMRPYETMCDNLGKTDADSGKVQDKDSEEQPLCDSPWPLPPSPAKYAVRMVFKDV